MDCGVHYATTLARGGRERGGREEAELVLCSLLSGPPSILRVVHSVAGVLSLIQHFTLYGSIQHFIVMDLVNYSISM